MQADVMRPTVVTGGALGALILAINQYVQTSEVLGSALAHRYGSRTAILIPVNQHNPVDAKDLAALKARLEELEGSIPVQLEVVRGNSATPDVWILGVDDAQLRSLTEALREKPGTLGWGSPKPEVDRLTTANQA